MGSHITRGSIWRHKLYFLTGKKLTPPRQTQVTRPADPAEIAEATLLRRNHSSVEASASAQNDQLLKRGNLKKCKSLGDLPEVGSPPITHQMRKKILIDASDLWSEASDED